LYQDNREREERAEEEVDLSDLPQHYKAIGFGFSFSNL
jgi:hypothetical protein